MVIYWNHSRTPGTGRTPRRRWFDSARRWWLNRITYMGKTRMKLKSLILVAIVGVISLAGCKPKETTIPGQVFIATSGGENIRLGAVEVLLIEKQQLTNYLQKRQAIIASANLEARQSAMASAKSEIASLQINLTNAVQNVEEAQKQVEQAKA